MTEVDLSTLNIGFDLRQLKMPIFFCDTVTKAVFEKDGKKITAEGTNQEIKEALENAGYTLHLGSLPVISPDEQEA